MGCCGNRRTQLYETRPTRPLGSPLSVGVVETRQRQFVVCFEYRGQTGLTVVGGATGKRYRFDRPGSRVVVDPRDRPSLATVPNLRQV